jgi:hypothetical protein
MPSWGWFIIVLAAILLVLWLVGVTLRVHTGG